MDSPCNCNEPKKNNKILILFITIIILCISCTTINHPRVFCNKIIACKKHPKLEEKNEVLVISEFNNGSNNFLYEDFPDEDLSGWNSDYGENLVDGNHRIGKIRNRYKEGKWLSGNVSFDAEGNIIPEGKVTKEEYFKKGLRDSIFRQFDNEGKMIYETTFEMGTGLWKEFHSNGKLYFEAYTKDGYFTDTLKLYNAKGELVEKRLYKKDILDYFINNNWCLKFRYHPNKDTYLEVDSFNNENLNQTDFRNTFRYKTKEEYDDDTFVEYTLKKITHEN